jgi:hypothetical protein
VQSSTLELSPGHVVPALVTIPATTPVYDIASPPYFWSGYGLLSNALVAARPGQFTGTHDDGIYAAPGATIQIPSDAGTATATALPAQNPPIDFGQPAAAGRRQFRGGSILQLRID